MLAERTINRFNGAVHECLEMCYESPDSLASLALYLQRLRSDGWKEADLEEVETIARRLLTAVAVPDRESRPASPPSSG